MLNVLLALAIAPFSVETNIVYAHPNNVELRMDVYRPAASAVGPLPGVVVIHGGAWVAGTKEDMAALCTAMAQRGLVAATVEYRLAPSAVWPKMFDDVQSAVRYLRLNSSRLGIDPERIGACGASAGGQLALLLGTRDTRVAQPPENAGPSSRVSAVFDLFGPTDLAHDFPSNFDFMAQILTGKKKADAGNEMRDMSAIDFVSKDTAPTFILHGTADPLVPLAQSKRYEAKLKELDVPVQAVYISGIKHEVNLQIGGVREAMEDGIAWLKKYLQAPASRNAA